MKFLDMVSEKGKLSFLNIVNFIYRVIKPKLYDALLSLTSARELSPQPIACRAPLKSLRPLLEAAVCKGKVKPVSFVATSSCYQDALPNGRENTTEPNVLLVIPLFNEFTARKILTPTPKPQVVYSSDILSFNQNS